MYVTLPYDPTGTNPDNHVGSEKHLVVEYAGMPYGMITLENGGFYTKNLKVYNAKYEPLTLNEDFIYTYEHKVLSDRIGLKVASAIVFLKPELTNTLVYVSAQMVGSDLAYSIYVVEEYVAFYLTRPAGYIPETMDYAGSEPIWGPGELADVRWGLDHFQPYVLELENISTAIVTGPPDAEDNFNNKVNAEYDAFVGSFTTTLATHLADRANPHEDDKADVNLGNVDNLKVATEVQARAGITHDAYMTPMRSYQSIDTNVTIPLNAHLALTHNAAHGETPVQVGAYDNATTTLMINGKYLKTQRVANSNAVLFDGVSYSYDNLRIAARTGLNPTHFTSGLFDPARLGFGSPSADTVLLGDGTWAPWSTIYSEYVPNRGSRLVFQNFGAVSDEATLRSWVNRDFGDLSQYGVGTVVFTYLVINYIWGERKGRKYRNSINHARQYIRTATGWTFTG